MGRQDANLSIFAAMTLQSIREAARPTNLVLKNTNGIFRAREKLRVGNSSGFPIDTVGKNVLDWFHSLVEVMDHPLDSTPLTIDSLSGEDESHFSIINRYGGLEKCLTTFTEIFRLMANQPDSSAKGPLLMCGDRQNVFYVAQPVRKCGYRTFSYVDLSGTIRESEVIDQSYFQKDDQWYLVRAIALFYHSGWCLNGYRLDHAGHFCRQVCVRNDAFDFIEEGRVVPKISIEE